jgi:subtilisin-like proprotein convertase family protein
MKKLFTFIVLTCLTININAQKNEPANATYTGTTMSMRVAPSIASRGNDVILAVKKEGEPQDGRSSRNKVVIGKDPQTANDYFASNPHYLKNKITTKAPSIVFEVDNNVGPPSDPSLAVGPDHVVIIYNTGFSIYDKSGVEIAGPLGVTNIFSGGGCCDLTISYDNAADRWVMSYLFIGNGIEVAVSDGPNPVTANWNVYSIPQINDYNKLSVWSDGYYVTDNTGAANKIYALERDEMLAGNASAQIIGFPLPGIVTSGFYSPQALNVSNDDVPADGGATFIYLQDDAWSGVSQDHIKLWTLDVDWDTPGNSTISAAQILNTNAPFISVFDGGNFSNLTQPGGSDIDALQATIMNQAQFRKFGNHNSAVFNFVVDTDASGGELAGVRWFELRQDDDNMPWSIYQEGTYTAPDGRHAWHASMIMDNQGNIGMGYTSMSGPSTPTTVRVSSYYTGRFANDPLNTMNIAEELIAEGTGNVGGFRYGDYSKIDVDPTNDKTFWFINEYIRSGGKDVVGVFQIAPNTVNDTGVVSIDSPTDGVLGANEDVVVTVFNFGDNTQSNIPVTLMVDGVSVGVGTIAGPLASSSTAQYTFNGIDFSIEGQTYSVESCTNLPRDEDTNNDCTTQDITHLFANDIGVTEITAPTNGEGMGMESITITIENFGGAVQSNFDVSYTLNGETPVIETVAGPLNQGSTLSYTFGTQGDFSEVGSHDLTVSTELAGDSDTSNDAVSTTIINLSCSTIENTTSQPVGPDSGTVTTSVINFTDDFVVNDVNVTININHTWDADLEIKLVGPNATEVILASAVGGQDDDFINTTFDDDADTPIADGSAPFTGSFQPTGSLANFNGSQSAGDWSLVITDNANGDEGTLNNWSLQLCGDITASVEDTLFDDSNFILSTLDNNQFVVEVRTTEINDRLNFSVTNMLGQKLLSYNIDNENGGYRYELDMSYATPGVYIIRLGNSKFGNTKKIIVK